MKVSGPFRDPKRRTAKKPWYLSYFAPELDAEGRAVLVDGKPVKKRRRPYYETKELAVADKKSLVDQYAAAGAGSFVHSRAAQLDYERARRVLPPKVSVEAAALFFLKHHPAGEIVTIEKARADFLEAMLLLHGKDAHYKDLKTRTLDLVQAFPGRDPNTITRKEAMTYLLNLPHKPRGKGHRRGHTFNLTP